MKRFGIPGRARFAAVAVIAGAAVCLTGVGYAAGLVHFKHSSATSAQYPPSKVTICHHTHSQHNPFVTITVSEHALPAHLGHGDTIGACSAQQQGSTQAQTGKPKKEKPAHQSHGNSAAAHLRKAERTNPADVKAGKSNHGKALGHGQNPGQAKAHGQGKGHDKNKSHGNGHGQGHGQGHGPGGRGNSGSGGKGNGHKP